MKINDSIIRIKDLRLRTLIGFNPEELEKKQDVIINIEIHYPAEKASETDDKNDAVNYKVITKRIISFVESGQFKLLEKLTAEVLNIVLENPAISYAMVTVDKPHALRFSDSVAISMSASQ